MVMSFDGKSLKLRYVGPRFDKMRLPIDILSDLPAFRDLLVAFAKEDWRKRHADRKRIPKGFDKSISFDLIAIEPGSTVPILEWNRSDAQANLLSFSDGYLLDFSGELEQIVQRSFSSVVDLIDGVGGDRFPKVLSSEHIRALNQLGSGLRDDERIEFVGTEGVDGKVVFFDPFRRKKLITKVRETYQIRFGGIGTLRGSVALNASKYIVVETAEYGNIQIPLELDRIKEEFDGNIGSDVQFNLQIELDIKDCYRSIINVYDVALIDAQSGMGYLRCRSRLEDLRSLSEGWNDGAGHAMDSSTVDAAQNFLSKRPFLSYLYHIYPTENAGIVFEFVANDWDLSVEFQQGDVIEMYGVQIDGRDEMSPQQFDAVDERFFAVFDARVGG
jgi:hypothetical protein